MVRQVAIKGKEFSKIACKDLLGIAYPYSLPQFPYACHISVRGRRQSLGFMAEVKYQCDRNAIVGNMPSKSVIRIITR